MEIQITKESLAVLKEIYKVYCVRREQGLSKNSSIRFSEDFSENTDIGDVESAKRELSKAKLISMDIIGGFELQDLAISFMEQLCSEEERAKQANESKQEEKRDRKKFKKFIGFVVAFVGFIGSVITIFQFWPEIKGFFSGLFS